jgi:DeoR/GlpR family transcriptional regulator of sugar metabolism
MTVTNRSGSPLLAPDRQSVILEYLRQHGTARVGELAKRLAVSEMTVRRDIDSLASLGVINRIHGGARLPSGLSQEEPGFAAKNVRQGAEKRAIAVEAATHVLPGMVVGISAGTTTYALSEELRNIPNITIVTNSIPVADPPGRPDDNRPYRGTVLLTGGERTPSRALVGPIAISSLSQLHLDILFLGVHGAEEQSGLTTPNLMESEVNRMLIAATNNVFVLADHSKWDTVGMSTFAPLDAADVFITDSGLSEGAREVLREHVGRLVIVDV